MSSLYERRLQQLADAEQAKLLNSIQRGIEKESLRITPDGRLAQTPHPQSLGSALTHSYITTDYSEALMEFITPVYTDIDSALGKLDEVHRFAYSQLDEELLWAASMPCVLGGDDNIPVAQYGSSNVARMKTVYRYGLGHRYGRLMQTIAGIHYNFSMPEAWWRLAQAADGDSGELQDYITRRYLDLIRNFRRWSWLLVYLFGASPAVCSSFLRGHDKHGLIPFDPDSKSLHGPFATALRMGDLGYQSNAQKNLSVCYDSLDAYIDTLKQAIREPHADYQAIGIGEQGHEQQLNTSLLQIENEFYSPIRPKRVAKSGETPLGALRRDGIEYIEVRVIDVNPYLPLGIDAEQIRFIDTFLLHCLLADSDPCDDADGERLKENMARVVNAGREPGLQLQTASGEASMAALADELMNAMAPIAAALDQANSSKDFSASLKTQCDKLADPALTPSARLLADMQEQDQPFFRLAMQASEQWAENFRQRPLNGDSLAAMQRESTESLQRQQAIEDADQVDFETYLDNYYRQYDAL
ncbi:MAG: glutamate--cysteine ligase [Halieaceae bacterium]